MYSQGTLWPEVDDHQDVCSNFHGGQPESIAANPPAATKQEQTQRIERAMGRVKDATCDEMEVRLSLPHQSCSARFAEMKRDGLIIATGEKRPTRAGKTAGVYRLATPAERGAMVQ